ARLGIKFVRSRHALVLCAPDSAFANPARAKSATTSRAQTPYTREWPFWWRCVARPVRAGPQVMYARGWLPHQRGEPKINKGAAPSVSAVPRENADARSSLAGCDCADGRVDGFGQRAHPG